ncbi:uncharacterized protein LOC134280015 [Saccostrea cucullata]|uniref:uncharacterized protein LOC134280015 n=1 Tax=Saccostrea cuccullata TaxID=36930 RepID=UPI002ED28B8F
MDYKCRCVIFFSVSFTAVHSSAEGFQNDIKNNSSIDYKGYAAYSDCESGYFGVNCSKVCRYPNYGIQCQLKCNCSNMTCHHITGCYQSTSEIDLNITTSHMDSDFPPEYSFLKHLHALIIIGAIIVLVLLLLFPLVAVAIVQKSRRPERKTEQELNFDSFGSFRSMKSYDMGDTTSERYCDNMELNGKSVENYDLEIYENTCIQGNMRTYKL